MLDAASTLGFTVAVGPESCLAIDDAVGCDAKVLAGEAWITATAFSAGETLDFMWALEGPNQNTLTCTLDGAVVARPPPMRRFTRRPGACPSGAGP